MKQQQPPMPKKEEVLIVKLKGRDCMNKVVVANKINEVIDRLEELTLELVEGGYVKKE